MTDLDAFLNDLEAKATAATPGPWIARGDESGIVEVLCWLREGEPVRQNESVMKGNFGSVLQTPPEDGVRCGLPESHDATFVAACDPDTIRLLVAVARAAQRTRHHPACVLGATPRMSMKTGDVCNCDLGQAVSALIQHVVQVGP